MSLSRTGKLLVRIANATAKDAIKWEETSEPGIYQTSFPNYTVQLADKTYPHPESREMVTDYVLSIYNKDLKLIEQVDDNMIREENPGMNPGPFSIMQSLYADIRRKVLGVDEAIGEILNILGPQFDNPTKPSVRRPAQVLENDEDLPF